MATPVFYDPRMNVTGLDSFSPSASKPARFVELLQHYNYRDYNDAVLGPVQPVELADLALVHDSGYICDVFSGVVLNGFECRDQRVPASCLWTIGSLLSAARYAIQHPAQPVCSPTSGFHHAGFSYGGGFCTFNGLMVVAAKLIQENPDFKVVILDCDMHLGDGTADILAKRPTLASHIKHFTAGKYFHGDDPQSDALEFSIWLGHSIDKINAFKPDLVLYQAGADPHINDPLGGFLTDDELRERDQEVFQGVRAPICYCHAGGYSRSKDDSIFSDPVLAIHRATLLEADFSVKTRIKKGLKP